MRTLSRFIPGEEIDVVSQWNFGAVDGESIQAAAKAKATQEASDNAYAEALRQEGYAQGFVQGQAHALLQAEQKIKDYVDNQGRSAAQQWAGLLAATREQLAQSQQVMAEGALTLACELAKQVLRHELSVNPNALQPVIREGLTLMAADIKSAVVRLNPQDIEVLQDVLRTEFSALDLTLVPDTTVKPGGCLIASGGTVVNGNLDARWRRAVAKLGLDVEWEE